MQVKNKKRLLQAGSTATLNQKAVCCTQQTAFFMKYTTTARLFCNYKFRFFCLSLVAGSNLKAGSGAIYATHFSPQKY
jgi:hypothetical protein